MSGAPRVVVVGASLAGLRAAEQLRAAGHDGPITVLGAEDHLPYNRPPLSKDALAAMDGAAPGDLAERLAFRRRASTGDVTFALGDPVVAADLAARTVTTAAGARHRYDGLVVATGLRSRRLDVPGPTRGRHTLRTVEDCCALAADLAGDGGDGGDGGDVVILGAGFIGCETAATLSALGHRVRVVEPVGAPMERVLGAGAGGAVQRHLEAAGIEFALGVGVVGYRGAERVSGVELSDGRVWDADVVVEAVGSVCNTEWLERNGLDLTDGVLTDNDLRVVGADRVVAVGDIARFPNPLFDDVPRRVEHWSMPTDTAKRAAATLVALMAGAPAADAEFAPLPSFWSDQLDLRLQSFGSPSLADRVTLDEGDLDRLPDGALLTYHRDGRRVGAVAVNLNAARQRELRQLFVPTTRSPKGKP